MLFLRYRIIDQFLTNKQRKFPDKNYIIEQLKDGVGEVSNSTFDKDIAEMKNRFNAPIAFDRVHMGYHYTDNTFSLKQFPLKEEEIAALDFSTS